MAKTLDADLNIIQRSGINIQIDPLTKDLNIIQALDDEPNDVGGLSAQQLKAKFDESGNLIKTYINDSLIPQVLSEGATEAQRQANETQRQENEQTRQENETARVQAEAARDVWEDYDPAKAYVPGNKVYYLGSSYVNTAACAGVPPTVEANWQMVAKKGADGEGSMSQDEADLRYLQLSGGIMTGPLNCPNPVFTGSISMGRKSGTTVGVSSVAEGEFCTASGAFSHAEGLHAFSNGNCGHAENFFTFSDGYIGSHAGGVGSIATTEGNYIPIKSFSGNVLIVDDGKPLQYSISSTLERVSAGMDIYIWDDNPLSWTYSVYKVASVDVSARTITLTGSIPNNVVAKRAVVPGLKLSSHNRTTIRSHVEGTACVAVGGFSNAMGYKSFAGKYLSHADGEEVIAAGDYQHVIGTFNVENSSINTKFIIGKGTGDTARSNCFRVTHSGVYASGNYNASGADYAELFEWADGNPDGEDRVGRFVTLDGPKIRLAGPEDRFILGVVSGNPSVIGDVHDDQWQGMYLYDVFGRPIWEDVEIPAVTDERPDPEDPENTITRVIVPAHVERRQKLNPDYDPSQKYLPRSQRPEWGCVGLMGKLVLLDDGSCQANGWAAPGAGGVATASEVETPWRVMERLDRDGMTLVRVMRV